LHEESFSPVLKSDFDRPAVPEWLRTQADVAWLRFIVDEASGIAGEYSPDCYDLFSDFGGQRAPKCCSIGADRVIRCS
jgi:hypothetical protein